MSIRRINKNKWEIDYYPQGRKGKRVRAVFWGSEDDARSLELELRRQSAALPNPTNPKIKDIMPEYLEWLELHRAQRTLQDVNKSLKWILPVFGEFPVSRITPTVINQFKKTRKGKAASIRKELNYLKGIISWMVRNNHANPLPFKVEMVPYRRPLPKIPHPSEIDRFLAQITDPMKKAMVLLMWHEGLRFDEVARLRWENVNWESGTINLERTKGDVPRVCIMPDEVKLLIVESRNTEGYIFPNRRTGQPYTSLKKLFQAASDRAGVRRIHPHLLRHAAATYTLEATGDVRLVQDMLGHRSITSTEFYTKVTMHRRRAARATTTDYIGTLKEQNEGNSKDI